MRLVPLLLFTAVSGRCASSPSPTLFMRPRRTLRRFCLRSSATRQRHHSIARLVKKVPSPPPFSPFSPPQDVLPPCRIPLAAQETFSSLAERLKVTPSALYALNGGDQPPSPSHFEGDVVDGAVIGPDGIVSRPSILFAHPYRLYAGETLQSVAAKFGVSAEEVMALNAATSTFVSNPTRLGPGHVVCVLPGVDLIRCPRVQ
jgi:hypothetical protein